MSTYLYAACAFSAGVGAVVASQVAYSLLKRRLDPDVDAGGYRVISLELNYWEAELETERFTADRFKVLLKALQEKLPDIINSTSADDTVMTLKASKLPVSYYEVAIPSDPDDPMKLELEAVMDARLNCQAVSKTKDRQALQKIVLEEVKKEWKDIYVPAVVMITPK